MDWLHCNACYKRYEPAAKFYITACGHPTCERCIQRMFANHNKCTTCNQITAARALSRELAPEIKCHFQPPGELLDQLKEVHTFQQKQMIHLLKYVSMRYNQAKGEIQRSHKQITDLQNENNQLKLKLKGTTGNNSLITSTPLSGARPPSLGASSYISALDASHRSSTTNCSSRRNVRMGGPYPSERTSLGHIHYGRPLSKSGSVSSHALDSPMPQSSLFRQPGPVYGLNRHGSTKFIP